MISNIKGDFLGRIKINKENVDIYTNRIYVLFLLFTVLALLGTFNQIFALLNLILCCYIIFKYSNRICVPFIIYATFFASIIKIPAVSDMSMITVVILLFSLKNIWLNEIDYKYSRLLLIFLVYTLYIQYFAEQFGATRNVKFFNGFIYVYFVASSVNYRKRDKFSLNYTSIMRAVIFGVIVSSLMRFADGDTFNISQYVFETTTDLGVGKQILLRFSGMYGDPNYYAVNVILAMCCTLFLYKKGDFSPIYTLITLGILGILGLLTRSKSAYLMFFVPLTLLIYINHVKKQHAMQALVLLGLIAGLVLIISGKISFFNTMLARFKRDTSINDLTTGRWDIWKNYINYFISNPLKFLFGSGISANVLKKAPHNTYIDLFYYLGLIGCVLYISLIIKLFNLKKPTFCRNFVNYGGIITIAAMYFFLSSLFDIDIVTNLIVMITMYNTNTKDKETINGTFRYFTQAVKTPAVFKKTTD